MSCNRIDSDMYYKISFFTALKFLIRKWEILLISAFAGSLFTFLLTWAIIPFYEGKIDIKMVWANYPYLNSLQSEQQYILQDVESPYEVKLKLIGKLKSNSDIREVCGFKKNPFLDFLEPVKIYAINKYSIISIKNQQNQPDKIENCLHKLYEFIKEEQQKLIYILQDPLLKEFKNMIVEINSLKVDTAKESLSSKNFESHAHNIHKIKIVINSKMQAQIIGKPSISVHSTHLERLSWIVFGLFIGIIIGMLIVLVRLHH